MAVFPFRTLTMGWTGYLENFLFNNSLEKQTISPIQKITDGMKIGGSQLSQSSRNKLNDMTTPDRCDGITKFSLLNGVGYLFFQVAEFLYLDDSNDDRLFTMRQEYVHQKSRKKQSGKSSKDYTHNKPYNKVCGGILIPSIVKLTDDLEEQKKLEELVETFADADKIMSLESNGTTFRDLMLKIKTANKRSLVSLQFHSYTAFHVLKNANRYVVVQKKDKIKKTPGLILPRYTQPKGSELKLFNAVMDYVLPRFQDALLRSYSELPENIRPRDARTCGWGVRGLPFTYVGLNILASPDAGVGSGIVFASSYDKNTGFHHGIHCHNDWNNAKGKLGAVLTLGDFSGFEQSLLPYATSMSSSNGSLLWADTSDIMHLVRRGTGFRISIVFCNHEFFEIGKRTWDGAQVVTKKNDDGTYEPYTPKE